MIKMPVICRLLNNLEGYLTDLTTATDITHEKYTRDIRLQRFVERTLQISIECCFDIVHHIIAENGFREPDSYADAFAVLAEQGVLTQESVREFQMMAQFRNKIVHYYEKIDPEQVYAIFKGKLTSFDLFKNQINGWVNANENRE